MKLYNKRGNALDQALNSREDSYPINMKNIVKKAQDNKFSKPKGK